MWSQKWWNIYFQCQTPYVVFSAMSFTSNEGCAERGLALDVKFRHFRLHFFDVRSYSRYIWSSRNRIQICPHEILPYKWNKVKLKSAHDPLYLQLGELNCEGRISRGLVEGILKAPWAAALRPNVTEHSYDGRFGWVDILILNQPCQHFKWDETRTKPTTFDGAFIKE